MFHRISYTTMCRQLTVTFQRYAFRYLMLFILLFYRENYGPYISSLRLHAFIELIAGTWKMEQAGKLVA